MFTTWKKYGVTRGARHTTGSRDLFSVGR